MKKNIYSDIDEDYPIIQSCGFGYAEKIKDIYETFGLKNTFNFYFGRLETTGTIYFKRKNDDSISKKFLNYERTNFALREH